MAFDSIIAPFEKDLDLRESILNNSAVMLNNFQGVLFWHITLSDLVNHYGKDYFTDNFNFAFIRNPWDWLVSMYSFIKGNRDHPEFMIVGHMNFSQFVDFWISKNIIQWDFLKTDAAVDLEIFKFEELGNACNKIAERIGVAKPELSRLNTSDRRDYSEYYNANTRQLVAEHFKKDIEIGGYEFHSKFWEAADVESNSFLNGKDPYIASDIVLKYWKHKGVNAAANECDRLLGLIDDVEFGPPHGDDFHIGMVKKIMIGFKRVFSYEGGDELTPKDVAADLHDAVRGSIWPRLWQLSKSGDRDALRRMACLYPYIYDSRISETLDVIVTFLSPHNFWTEICELLSEAKPLTENDSLNLFQLLRWQLEAQYEIGNVADGNVIFSKIIISAYGSLKNVSLTNEIIVCLKTANSLFKKHNSTLDPSDLKVIIDRAFPEMLDSLSVADTEKPIIALINDIKEDFKDSLRVKLNSCKLESDFGVDHKLNESNNYFKTESGCKIPIVEGYRSLFPNFYWGTPERKKDQEASQQTFPLFLNHVYKYGLVIDYLEALGVKTKWEKALDIGAMDGTLSRLFLADGKVVRADAIDLTDNRKKLSDATFSRHIKELEYLQNLARKLPKKKKELLTSVPLFHEMCAVPTEQSPFWHKFSKGRAINRFVEGDFKSVQLEDKYDLVTSFLTMITLDLDIVMAGISQQLRENGTFIMMEPYWWYPYLFFGVAGEFPYAFQQFNEKDMLRYIETHHAEDKQFLIERLSLFKQHTINDYITAASRHGLSLLGEKRFVQMEDVGDYRAKLSPQFMNRHADVKLERIVENIQKFKPDVQVLDLMTSYTLLVFRKKSNSLETLSTAIRGL